MNHFYLTTALLRAETKAKNKLVNQGNSNILYTFTIGIQIAFGKNSRQIYNIIHKTNKSQIYMVFTKERSFMMSIKWWLTSKRSLLDQSQKMVKLSFYKPINFTPNKITTITCTRIFISILFSQLNFSSFYFTSSIISLIC